MHAKTIITVLNHYYVLLENTAFVDNSTSTS